VISGSARQAVGVALGPKHNLPSQISTFVGREHETRQVQRLLHAARLVTLSGAGGIGKTRLALEAASRVVDDYADGVWLVELGPVGDPAFVPQAVASALGLLEERGRPLVETLERTLRSMTCLLVIDNCEHLLAATTALADRLLRACPGLQVLATSREPLGLGGETVWRVPPLGLPRGTAARRAAEAERSPAERLFFTRAAAALPGFDNAGQHGTSVQGICRRLDGIPLAIELAAACIAFLSPAQLLARLEESPGFLRGTDHTAPARHQTMVAAIEWSYNLLSEDERRLFVRLSAFAGGFSLEAAEFVCSGLELEPERSLDLLRQLVTKSLVVVESGKTGVLRYRLLEPLRNFGVQLLRDIGEEDGVQQQHAAFYVALAQRSNLALLPGAGGPWLEPMARDHDNLQSAVRWLFDKGHAEDAQQVGTAVAEVWRQRGHIGEARALVAQLISLPGAGEQTVPRAGLLLLAGQLASFQGDNASARVLLEQSVMLCRVLQLPAGLARTLARLAEIERAQGRYDVAHSLVEAGVLAVPPSDDRSGPVFQAGCRFWHALIYLDEAEYERADALARELLPALDAGGWTRIAGHALLVLGVCAAQQGDLARARQRLEESLAKWNQSDRWGAARALIELGRLALGRGDYEHAGARLAECLALSRDLGDPWSAAGGLEVSAVLASRAGHPARAVRLAEAAAAARDRAQVVQSPRERAWLGEHLGAVERSLPRSRYVAERQAGRTMTLEQAVELALIRDRNDDLSTLTPREREVARLLSGGCSDARIAQALVISRRTAEVHVRNILGKLGLTSRAQIAVWAVDRGLRQTELSARDTEPDEVVRFT
jgi:predicted ATPase/DNA-binding CsgD family transcriptional regulator